MAQRVGRKLGGTAATTLLSADGSFVFNFEGINPSRPTVSIAVCFLWSRLGWNMHYDAVLASRDIQKAHCQTIIVPSASSLASFLPNVVSRDGTLGKRLPRCLARGLRFDRSKTYQSFGLGSAQLSICCLRSYLRTGAADEGNVPTVYSGHHLSFLVSIWRARIAANTVMHRTRGFITLLAVTIAISGWWYAEQLLETGNIIGSIDIILLGKMGGLLLGLSNNGSLSSFANGFLYLAVTFLWTAIFIPPLITYLPLLCVGLLLGWGNVKQFRFSNITATDWVALLTLLGLLIGLFNQMAVWIALWGAAEIPGYYLHSFAPVLALLVERGMGGIKASRLYSGPMVACLFFPLLFLPLGMIVQAQYFSGCSSNQSIVFYYNVFSSGPGATDVPKIIDNLSVLAFPQLAIGFFIFGWIFMFCGALAALTQIASARSESRQFTK